MLIKHVHLDFPKKELTVIIEDGVIFIFHIPNLESKRTLLILLDENKKALVSEEYVKLFLEIVLDDLL